MNSPLLVLDTDVFVWLTRGKSKAADYAPYVEGKRVVLSFATVAELWRGAYALGYNEASRQKLRADIDATVVVAPTPELTDRWAHLTDACRKAGHALGDKAQTHDAWVAATAIHYEVALLTGDSHFDGVPDLVLADRPTP